MRPFISLVVLVASTGGSKATSAAYTGYTYYMHVMDEGDTVQGQHSVLADGRGTSAAPAVFDAAFEFWAIIYLCDLMCDSTSSESPSYEII